MRVPLLLVFVASKKMRVVGKQGTPVAFSTAAAGATGTRVAKTLWTCPVGSNWLLEDAITLLRLMLLFEAGSMITGYRAAPRSRILACS